MGGITKMRLGYLHEKATVRIRAFVKHLMAEGRSTFLIAQGSGFVSDDVLRRRINKHYRLQPIGFKDVGRGPYPIYATKDLAKCVGMGEE